MVIEAREASLGDFRRPFIEVRVCPEDQIDEKIRYYKEQYPEFSKTDEDAAAVALDMLLSMSPVGRERFKNLYGIYPNGTKVIKEMAFGGLEIDPQNANLPNIK